MRQGDPGRALSFKQGACGGVCTGDRIVSRVLKPGVPNTAPQLHKREKETQNTVKH